MRATILPQAIIMAKGSTASQVFLIFTTKLYQYFSVFFLFAPFTDKPEVFIPEYSQTATHHAAYFQRVVMPQIFT